MRLLLAAVLLALSPAALAQVTTNDQALDSLKSPPAPESPAAATDDHAAAKPRHVRRVTHASPAPAKPAQKLPRVPPAPPANPVIAPPPLVLPAHAPEAAPPVPMRADAPGQASPLPQGARITFGAGSAVLNPATFGAILSVAAQARANPAMIVGVTAWAPGTADDPSTPRRLSLDRALAARAVLIANGIVSERIRAVAKGMTDIGAAPADRVEVTEILPEAKKK
jgi:outer membrane protein OmpA-like peptidoglycan-associated protein